VDAAETVFVEAGHAMSYLANRSNPGIGLSWTLEGFDAQGWPSGVYGVGYETATGAQNLIETAAPAGTFSVYTRTLFTVADASQVTSLFLGADFDDGYAAWINGVEVYRSPTLPGGTLAWNTAAQLHESSNGQTPNYAPLQDVSAAGIPALHDGVNVLAIGVWNAAATSSDLVVVPWLSTGSPATVTRGPYLQSGTPTSVVVRWRTSIATNSRVRLGPAPGSLTFNVDDPALTTEHVVSVAGLSPNAQYYYSVGTTAEPLAGDDAAHSFVTSPATGTSKPTRIWVLGDSGTANANAQAVRNAYATFTGSTPTDLWLMLGDNAYPDGTDAEYQAAVFDMYPDMLRKAVLWPTLGNHDGHTADSATQSGPYYDMFTLPRNGEAGGLASGTEAYYSFDYESIQEVQTGGRPSTRQSLLEHKWTLDVQAGSSVTFYLLGYHSRSTDGDDFVFSYSTDDVAYTDMLTLTKTAADGQYLTHALPATLSGTVFVRVRDTNRTPGARTKDTVFVDHLLVRTVQ
jgi:hypothetical protein